MTPAELCCAHQGLVVHFAKKHKETFMHINLAELIAAGKIGLMKAAERFDPRKGKFSTYAAFWIKKEMFRALPREKLPVAFSLDAQIGADLTGHDVIPDKKTASELLRAKDIAGRFRRLMVAAGLDTREMEIISQRYGLSDEGRPKTQRHIARELRLSRARIGQIEKIAREKITEFIKRVCLTF
jgi:RNA polymerase sporulation-specific sigma factor